MRAFLALAVVLVCSLHPNAAQSATDVPFEQQPYRVLISIAFQPNAVATATFRKNTLDRTAQLCSRTFSQMWNTDVTANDRLSPPNGIGLGRLNTDQLQNLIDTDGYDKVFLLVLESADAGYTVHGREWDAASGQFRPVESSSTRYRRSIPQTIVGLLARLFHPVLTIGRSDGESVSLRLRAGAFPAADPDAAQLRIGDVIVPFFRYLDKDRVVQRIQFLSWTYLIVEDIDRGRVDCTLVSGYRSPLGTRRRRVELMGSRLRAQSDATILTLITPGQPPQPLAGFRLNVVSKLRRRDEPAAEPIPLITDRQGRVRIEVDPERPLVWIEVNSGESLMARVPFAPGIQTTETVDLPDDSRRLRVEGELALLKGRLIDTVARRATLISRIRIAAEEQDWKSAAQRMQELDLAPGRVEFETQLTAIRVPALEAARRENDRLGERKIQRMCGFASQLITRYLDDDQIYAAREELEERRALNDGRRR